MSATNTYRQVSPGVVTWTVTRGDGGIAHEHLSPDIVRYRRRCSQLVCSFGIGVAVQDRTGLYHFVQHRGGLIPDFGFPDRNRVARGFQGRFTGQCAPVAASRRSGSLRLAGMGGSRCHQRVDGRIQPDRVDQKGRGLVPRFGDRMVTVGVFGMGERFACGFVSSRL